MMKLFSSKRGINLSNSFASVFGFLLGIILVYSTNGIITSILDMFEAGIVKLILTFAYIMLVILISVYVPLMILTAVDNVKGIK